MMVRDADHARERAVIGAALIWRERVIDELELRPGHFDEPRHAEVWEAILAVGDAAPGRQVDLVEVEAWLRAHGRLKNAGGPKFLWQLGGDAALSVLHHLPQHAARLRELAHARRVRQGLLEAAEIADSDQMVGAAAAIADVLDGEEEQARSIGQVVGETWKAIADAAAGKRVLMPTGLQRLDDILEGGLEPENLVVVGGRPSMGKTALVLTWAGYAVTHGVAVYIASLEMSARECLMRIASRLALIDYRKLRVGDLTQMEGERLGEVLTQLSQAPLQIDDRAFTLSQIRARYRRFRRRHPGLCWGAVDYLQLVVADPDRERRGPSNREQEVAAISRSMKLLAKETRTPLVVVSQLNRGLETRQDKRPQLADLRESGAIEQDADTVIFVYRDEVYNPPTDKTRNIGEVLVRKQRNGALGNCECIFKKEMATFFNKHNNAGAAA